MVWTRCQLRHTQVVIEVLDKLPSEHDVRSIDLSRELARRRGEREPPAS